MRGPDDSGGPCASKDSIGDRVAGKAAGDAPLGRLLPFEIPFDGLLNCAGDCPYGPDLRQPAPVVPIADRAKPSRPTTRR